MKNEKEWLLEQCIQSAKSSFGAQKCNWSRSAGSVGVTTWIPLGTSASHLCVEVNFWPAEWEVVHNFPDLTTEDRTVFHWFYINERVQRYPNEWLSSTLISKRWMYTIKKNRYCACVQRVCRCVCFMDERWRDTVVVLFGRRQKNHNGRVTKIVTNGSTEQTTSCHSHLLEVKIQRAGRWKWFWYSYGNERRTRCCGKGNEGTYRPNQKEGIDTGC